MTDHPPVPDELFTHAIGMHIKEREIFAHMLLFVQCQHTHINNAFAHLNDGDIADARKELHEGLVHYGNMHAHMMQLIAERNKLHDETAVLAREEIMDHVQDPAAAKIVADFMKKL